MEAMAAVPFISLIVIAITQMVKMALPKVSGWVTLLVSLVASVLVSVFGAVIGIESISIAGAVAAWFTAVGLATLAAKAGGGASGDDHVVAR